MPKKTFTPEQIVGKRVANFFSKSVDSAPIGPLRDIGANLDDQLNVRDRSWMDLSLSKLLECLHETLLLVPHP